MPPLNRLMKTVSLLSLLAVAICVSIAQAQQAERPLPYYNAKMVYVSPTGDDTNSGLSAEEAVQTVERGLTLLRDGQADWLLLERGHDYELTHQVGQPSGAAPLIPMVITAYGEGSTPELNVGPNSDRFSQDSQATNHIMAYDVTMVGLDNPFPILQPGTGWTGPTEQPDAVGTAGMPGYDAKAIARWDVVPYQTFDDKFHIGVVAFHMNGIDRVSFSVDNGPWVDVHEMQQNSRVGIDEYVVTLDATQFSASKLVEIRAVAFPKGAGEPRVLAGPIEDLSQFGVHSMFLYANANHEIEERIVYVAGNSGSDETGTGSRLAPFKTLAYAAKLVYTPPLPTQGRILISEPGTYEFGRVAYPFRNNDLAGWLTVSPVQGLNRDQVTIAPSTRAPLRPDVSRIHWQNLSFDLSKISGFYMENDSWFDQCYWSDPAGRGARHSNHTHPLRVVEGQQIYVTDSTVYDNRYGFTQAALLRNSTAEKIAVDTLQNNHLVLNVKINDVDGDLLEDHTDFCQIFGEADNYILYGVEGTNLIATQGIFLEPTYLSQLGSAQYTMQNCAFVDVDIQTNPIFWPNGEPRGGPPYSQLMSRFDHVLFDRVQMPNQRLYLRSDIDSSNQAFHAKNVFFRECHLFPGTYDLYHDETPPVGTYFGNNTRSSGAE